MKQLISMSLYGSGRIYWQGALRNARLAQSIYPGWTVRFYVSDEIPADLIQQLQREGAEIIPMQRRGAIDGMFWRFLPAADSQLGAVVVRDCDSRLTLREKHAVEEWLQSGTSLHIMRDHPRHGVPIMGGMWGCRGGSIADMPQLVADWSIWDAKGQDQDFLADVIYPRFRRDHLVHSDFVVLQGERALPFPTPRQGGEFVGCVYEADRDTLTQEQHDEYVQLLSASGRIILPARKPRLKLYRRWRYFIRSFRRKAA